MKYIVLGLGSFGSALAEHLTNMGHEVIGIDNRMDKVEFFKDKISHTIFMDSTDQFTMGGLPWKDTDVAVVAIGEDPGASIMTTAVLKNLKVKKVVSRSISDIHETVLHAIGVHEIIHPEKEAANRWAKKLTRTEIADSFELNKNYSIAEIRIPEKYAGKTVAEIGFRNRFNLAVLTTMSQRENINDLGNPHIVNEVKGVASYETVINAGDLVVVYGLNKDIEKFINS